MKPRIMSTTVVDERFSIDEFRTRFGATEWIVTDRLKDTTVAQEETFNEALRVIAIRKRAPVPTDR